MCYIIITGRSLIWFILTLTANMCILSSIVTPKWLIGPERFTLETNFTIYRYPSVGIYTRCKMMDKIYNCGPFDFEGLLTENSIYPPEWKAAMFFISLALCLMTITVFLTLITFCRQSIFGKSIHNITGSMQAISGILIMLTIFLHPLGWGSDRVVKLCGPDAEAFFPGECTIGWAFYTTVASICLCFVCAGISLKAESANMRSRVKRRVEGGERLVFVP